MGVLSARLTGNPDEIVLQQELRRAQRSLQDCLVACHRLSRLPDPATKRRSGAAAKIIKDALDQLGRVGKVVNTVEPEPVVTPAKPAAKKVASGKEESK